MVHLRRGNKRKRTGLGLALSLLLIAGGGGTIAFASDEPDPAAAESGHGVQPPVRALPEEVSADPGAEASDRDDGVPESRPKSRRTNRANRRL